MILYLYDSGHILNHCEKDHLQISRVKLILLLSIFLDCGLLWLGFKNDISIQFLLFINITVVLQYFQWKIDLKTSIPSEGTYQDISYGNLFVQNSSFS